MALIPRGVSSHWCWFLFVHHRVMTAVPTSSPTKGLANWSSCESWASPSSHPKTACRPCSTSATWTKRPRPTRKTTSWTLYTRTASRRDRKHQCCLMQWQKNRINNFPKCSQSDKTCLRIQYLIFKPSSSLLLLYCRHDIV